jgi:hypothetical protein
VDRLDAAGARFETLESKTPYLSGHSAREGPSSPGGHGRDPAEAPADPLRGARVAGVEPGNGSGQIPRTFADGVFLIGTGEPAT